MPSAGVEFVTADASHDAAIRQLLRESAMDGDVSLSFQTEPSYFAAAAIDGDEHHAVVALENGRAVCVGGVSIRPRYLNGRVRRVGYLGRLRLARSHAGRFDVIRRGYAYFGGLRTSLYVDAFFTSIAADNGPARRLLERGLRGFPAYQYLGDLVTLLVRTDRRPCAAAAPSARVRRAFRQQGVRLRHGEPATRQAVAAVLERHSPTMQFAPNWSAEAIARAVDRSGLTDNAFRLLHIDGRPVGCCAAWDQRAFKQIVVTQYGRRLRLLRPLHNSVSRWTGRGIPLPPAGATLPQAFVSHVGLPTDKPDWLVHLILSLTASARTMDVRTLAVGLDARDPRLLSVIAAFRPFVYRTRLYAVHWPGTPPDEPPDGRLMGPEIALL